MITYPKNYVCKANGYIHFALVLDTVKNSGQTTTGTLYKNGQAIKTLSVSSSAYGAQANGRFEVNKGDIITYTSSNDFNTYVHGNAFTAMAMIVAPL